MADKIKRNRQPTGVENEGQWTRDIVVRLMSEQKFALRSRSISADYDWHQSEMEFCYLQVIESIVEMVARLSTQNEFETMVTCILKRFGELISVLEGQAPDVVQNRVELLHGRVKRLAADVIADLQPRIALSEDGEPQVESQNNDMLDIRGSKVGMIYGPVGHVEQVDDGSPKLVIYSPRWKEIQERINDAIVNRRGFVGPGCRSYSAGNLEVLDNLLDGMTQGELSYSSNQTVTP